MVESFYFLYFLKFADMYQVGVALFTPISSFFWYFTFPSFPSTLHIGREKLRCIQNEMDSLFQENWKSSLPDISKKLRQVRKLQQISHSNSNWTIILRGNWKLVSDILFLFIFSYYPYSVLYFAMWIITSILFFF